MTGFYPGSYEPSSTQSAIDRLTHQLQATPQTPALNLPPAVNPMMRINPMYTHQAPQNSLSPMQMYQAYRQTGQIPAETSSFRPMGSTNGSPGAFSMTQFSPSGTPAAGSK